MGLGHRVPLWSISRPHLLTPLSHRAPHLTLPTQPHPTQQGGNPSTSLVSTLSMGVRSEVWCQVSARECRDPRVPLAQRLLRQEPSLPQPHPQGAQYIIASSWTRPFGASRAVRRCEKTGKNRKEQVPRTGGSQVSVPNGRSCLSCLGSLHGRFLAPYLPSPNDHNHRGRAYRAPLAVASANSPKLPLKPLRENPPWHDGSSRQTASMRSIPGSA